MLITFLEVVLLIGLIIAPLVPRRRKQKSGTAFTLNNDTTNADYAVNENGRLEKLERVKPYNTQV